MNRYHHFTTEERTWLRKYYMEKLSFRKIARLLGRSPSSFSCEYESYVAKGLLIGEKESLNI